MSHHLNVNILLSNITFYDFAVFIVLLIGLGHHLLDIITCIKFISITSGVFVRGQISCSPLTKPVAVNTVLCYGGLLRWLGGLLVERRTSVSQIRGSIPGQVAAV